MTDAFRLKQLCDDRGAALITVLLLVSVMALGAVLTFEALGYSVKRTSAQREFDQARQYALGGEQLVISFAESLHENEVLMTEPKAVSFPIETGRIDGVVSDISNCFNVNGLVSRQDTGTYIANAVAGHQYARLLQALGFGERQANQLVAALTDWLDSDTRALPLGGEDYDYGVLARPYRTANSLVADISELNLVQGYEPGVMQLVAPYLCADLSTAPSALNVNSMAVDQAPLLVALIGGDFTIEKAIELVLARPGTGYGDIADFWLEPVFAERTIEQSIREQTTIKPHRFSGRIRVTYYDAVGHLTTEVRVDDTGTARIIRHQAGVLP